MPFLQTLAQDLFTGVLGSFVGGGVKRANFRKDYELQRELGFTHSEIAGAGGFAGAGQSDAVLGNNWTQMQAQRRQQKFEADQRDKDRLVQLAGQETQLKSAQTAAGASMYGADTQAKIAEARLALETKRYQNITLPQAINDLLTSTPQWKRQELMARMGVDNMIATLVAGARGLDIMDPKSLERLSQPQFRELVTEMYGLQSYIFSEGSGALTFGKSIWERGAEVLGFGE